MKKIIAGPKRVNLDPLNEVYNIIHGMGEPYDAWHWRSKSEFLIRVMTAMNGGEPDYASFTPKAISNGKHHKFIWVEFNLNTEMATVYEGDISECPFKLDDIMTEIYFPRGWSFPVMRLIASGIVGFDDLGHAIMSNGDTGPLSEHPAFECAGEHITPKN